MGVMARKVDELFIITSDRILGEVPSNHAPKKRMIEEYQVWTGDKWSTQVTEAKEFETMDIADEYMRANYSQVLA